MRKKFTLRCTYCNPQHCGFTLFDQHGANCGTITVRRIDVADFIAFDWDGDVDWREHRPEEISK
jgi:hypothetical protein